MPGEPRGLVPSLPVSLQPWGRPVLAAEPRSAQPLLTSPSGAARWGGSPKTPPGAAQRRAKAAGT